MKSLFITLVAFVVAMISMARTAGDFFASAPKNTFLIDSITRLDMLDYYRSGSSVASSARLGAPARVTDESDRALRVDIDSILQYQVVVLTAKNDTVLAVVETLRSTLPDSHVRFYDTEWTELPQTLMPAFTLEQWLTPEGQANRHEVEGRVPFIFATYDIDPETMTLTATNSMQAYYVPDDWAEISAWLRPQLQLAFNGKRFVAVPTAKK